MIDLFGLGKTPESEPPRAAPEPAAPAAGGHGSHRLWAFLLVLDSIFVIVFGGALAAKVYEYWRSPAAAAPAGRPQRRVLPKAPEAAKPAEPAPSSTTVAAKPAAPPKAAEPEKPAAKPEPKIARADAPRPPKPSLLNEPPKPRATPSPATAAESAAAARAAGVAAPAAPAGKALPVVFKLKASGAGSVQLVGAFIVHGGRKEMAQAKDGTWSVKLYLNPGQYRYFFAVDKKKTLDPENPNSDRGASLLTVP